MDLIFPAIPKERIVFKAIRVSIGIREEKVARIIPFFLGPNPNFVFGLVSIPL